MYEIQKRVSEGTLQSASDVASRFAESLEESAEENDKVLAPVTRGVRLNRRIEGKDKVPYGEMAEVLLNIMGWSSSAIMIITV